jgi:hypothetical protein
MFKITPQTVNRFSLAEILLILAINLMEVKRAARSGSVNINQELAMLGSEESKRALSEA